MNSPLAFPRHLPKQGQRWLAFALLALPFSTHAALFGDDEARQAIQRVDHNVHILEGRLKSSEESLKNQSDALNQLEIFRQDIAQLRGQIELLQNDAEKLKQNQRDFYSDIDQRLKRLEQQPSHITTPQAENAAPSPAITNTALPAELPSSNSSTTITATAEPQPTATVGAIPAASPEITEVLKSWKASPSNEKRHYDMAISRWKADKHADAAPMLIYFATLYPNSPQSPAALYRAGLSARVTKTPTLAKEAFQQIVQHYPANTFAPKALFMLGQVVQEQGDLAGARRLWQNIINHYPNADIAEKAKQALKATAGGTKGKE